MEREEKKEKDKERKMTKGDSQSVQKDRRCEESSRLKKTEVAPLAPPNPDVNRANK